MKLETMVEYIRGQRSGVISTLGPDGRPQAAYLPITATNAGELIFDAKPESRKVANLLRDGRIAVVVGGLDGTTLQGEGRADVTEGAEEAEYGEQYLRSFPEHAASVRGGSVVIIRIRLDWARFGDFRSERSVVTEILDL